MDSTAASGPWSGLTRRRWSPAAEPALGVVGQFVRRGSCAGRRVDAGVARDLVDPRLEGDRPLGVAHAAQRGEEDLLRHVLRARVVLDHPSHVRGDTRVVALIEHLEGAIIATTNGGDRIGVVAAVTATVAAIPLISPTLLQKFPPVRPPLPRDRNQNCKRSSEENFNLFFDESRTSSARRRAAARSAASRTTGRTGSGPRHRGGGDGGHRGVRQPRVARACPRRGAGLVLVFTTGCSGRSARALARPLALRLRTLLEAGMGLAAYHLPLDAHPEVSNNALHRTTGLTGATAASPSPRSGSRRRSLATRIPAGELFEERVRH